MRRSNGVSRERIIILPRVYAQQDDASFARLAPIKAQAQLSPLYLHEPKPYDGEPPVWFPDIFRRDGTPYIQGEIDYIRKVTGQRGSISIRGLRHGAMAAP